MIFGIPSIYVWVAVIIASVAIEAFTLNLSAIWFAVGGVAALFAASIELKLLSQLWIFALFSAALLLLVRPFCRKFLHVTREPTNADRIIGEPAIVITDIDPVHNTGEIRVFGQVWTAKSIDDTPIPAGAAVRIIAIRGVKAVVERA